MYNTVTANCNKNAETINHNIQLTEKRYAAVMKMLVFHTKRKQLVTRRAYNCSKAFSVELNVSLDIEDFTSITETTLSALTIFSSPYDLVIDFFLSCIL